MAGKTTKNGIWEYVFRKAGVLEKPLYLTFDTEAEGDAYAERLEALLDQGILPALHRKAGGIYKIVDMDREYQRDAHPCSKDRSCLRVIVRKFGQPPVMTIDAQWVEEWITSMKRDEWLAPASI